jgi:hypothetical protein
MDSYLPLAFAKVIGNRLEKAVKIFYTEASKGTGESF